MGGETEKHPGIFFLLDGHSTKHRARRYVTAATVNIVAEVVAFRNSILLRIKYVRPSRSFSFLTGLSFATDETVVGNIRHDTDHAE